ncbi:RHS repeat-associated core domain-containing protein [Peribacillus frigoritolerans]|uniref:RHS repeat-associated core domain-containing protein n=1 Tax=Peribacillus frigoritolerans TaxID=450367 RepID=UPI003BAEF9D4
MRFAWYYFDLETRNYYLQARYYNPKNGNFLALDLYPGDDYEPISQNGYSYANNNPLIMDDPYGNKSRDGENSFELGIAIY